jgi:hypothetical protein
VSTVSPKFEGGPIKTEEPSLVASLRKRNQRPLVTHKRSIGSPPAFRRRHVPTESIGKADNFIDDLIVIILGVPGNISRSNAAAALALELVSRPPSAARARTRFPWPSGFFQQTNYRMAPGWSKNNPGMDSRYRRLLLSLIKAKYKEWSADILKMISGRFERRQDPQTC